MTPKPPLKKSVKVKNELSHKISFVKKVRQVHPWLMWQYSFFDDCIMDDRTLGQYIQLQRFKSWPDFFFPKPIANLHGLYIEVKTGRSEVFNQDGTMVASQHIKDQWDMIQRLRGLGYWADWGFGDDGSLQVLNDYLGR